jgi:hypothetical protein
MRKPNPGGGQTASHSRKTASVRPGPAAGEAESPDVRRGPKPNPPRPSKPLLAFAAALLVIWMAFLALLALLARKWV